jgi:formate dehydrogenase subunit delta
MSPDKLVHMANSIGDYFAAYPDADEARAGIATHLRRFWDPRMRRAMLAHVDRTGGTGLHPLVLQALQRHRTQLDPPAPG